jgi:hypothetical protein
MLFSDEPTDMEVDNVDNLNIGNLNQQIAKEEQDVIAITASNEQTLSAIAAASVHGDDTSVALETDDKKVVDEIVEDALAVATEVNQEAVGGALDSTDSSTDVVVETTIETKVETKVEVRLLSPEEAEALCINVERTQKIEETNHTETMVDIEETEQEAEAAAAVTTSSWASAFGIKSLFDVLSSPFRSRKSSS